MSTSGKSDRWCLSAQEYVADVRQQLLSAVTLLSCLAVYERSAQRYLRVGQREIVSGSFGGV